MKYFCDLVIMNAGLDVSTNNINSTEMASITVYNTMEVNPHSTWWSSRAQYQTVMKLGLYSIECVAKSYQA